MTAVTLMGSDEPLSRAHDAVLVDLDGVVYRGPDAVPGAPQALNRLRDAGTDIVYVTNNASREPGTVADQLISLGINATADDVMTSAQAIAAVMTEQLSQQAKVLVVGGGGLRTAVVARGFAVVDDARSKPDAVVQGFAPEVSWRELAEASYAIAAGAMYFASNLDLTIPNERGTAPGNGSLVQVVVNATGVTPQAAGKPEPGMFHMAAAKVSANRPVVVGDRLDTDIKGARAAGQASLMVLTGVDGVREAILAPPAERPSYLGSDIAAVEETHPHPSATGAGWRVREAYAEVIDGVLSVDGGDPLDRARAACVAAWASADAGIPVGVQGASLNGERVV